MFKKFNQLLIEFFKILEYICLLNMNLIYIIILLIYL